MNTTSYSREYQWPERTTWGVKHWPKDRTLNTDEIKSSNPIFRNCETLTQAKMECLPTFNLLLTKKPIVQTNPQEHFLLPAVPKEDDRARLTRPRVYKCPEISLDDIENPDIRKKIIDYTYSTTSELASKDGALNVTNKLIPDCVWEPPYHVLFNKKDSLNNEFCEGTTVVHLNEWDKEQSRQVVDATMSFWRHHRTQKPVKVVDQTAIDVRSPEHTEKILDLARGRRLRLPYMLKPSPSYAGHMPEFPLEIEPEKPQQDRYDPMISVYQLSNRWLEY